MFEESFDVIFRRNVETETFRLPLSVKELRLFSLKICQGLAEHYFQSQSQSRQGSSLSPSTSSSSSQSEKDSPKNCQSDKAAIRTDDDAPIGLNSLSKTFNILKIVGRGNFGRVFKAENKFDHRLFALKQIPITPREDLKKVLQEVENLSKAGKHKNVVKYLDCFLIQEERRAGGDLTENNSEETSSSESTSRYWRDTADHQTNSESFIKFQDISGSEMREILTSQKVEGVQCQKKRISISEPSFHDDRPASAEYSDTLSCICIKVQHWTRFLNTSNIFPVFRWSSVISLWTNY